MKTLYLKIKQNCKKGKPTIEVLPKIKILPITQLTVLEKKL